ncbi:hypothetical protein ASH00_13075 [Arthrobacter sp. Soil782]|uniref:GmrSD restriction endonuclease domain-containing protein n=1 Tax=Arthrobacter sp. Soil782 TaxID=1736410 RepID=UPI0006FB46F5|nr:DUF262 domain-containing protein [Arthrobacter sp. Soil782]KRF05308.1 hypothetical protein ASH00_13075 [Arthrobacter sp. Soil782]
MKTDVVKPKDVFYNPTRLVVPLFQRPYVWSRETQWEPLWQDIVRLIDVISEHVPDATHFLGAIVIQQVPTTLGSLPAWNVIDGQQRLTTLQLLLDALHAELIRHGWTALSEQIEPLVENPPAYREQEHDRYKLWPTNRDREGFTAVMSAQSPVDYSGIPKSRLADAHKFFAEAMASWIGDGDNAERRGRMLVATIMDRLEIASIRLDANEDAQAIFETLNARGTPLSAADLIKNFIFQNIPNGATNAESTYLKYWADFETPWWEAEVTTGRIKNSRASLFLWQWLTARTLTDFPIREVFTQFKHYVNTVAKDIGLLLPQIKTAADRYRAIIEGAQTQNGPLTRVELFGYRVGTLDSEIARPLLIWLDESEQSVVPNADRERILATLESWFVRRALVKAQSQGSNRFIVDLLQYLSKKPKVQLAAEVEAYLLANHTAWGYWPGDDEVREALIGAPAYWRYLKGRLRMVLEALEDHKRGYPDGRQLAMGPIVRSRATIEHLMPQKWRKHWPAELTEDQEAERDRTIQQLGNLTIVTQSLNSKVSNGPWRTKRDHFLNSDDVLITKDAMRIAGEGSWSEREIIARTNQMIEQILNIWPAPAGHVGLRSHSTAPATTVMVDLALLVSSGWLEVGAKLSALSAAYQGAEAAVAQDGRVFVNGVGYDTPTGAARSITQTEVNGWAFWGVVGTTRSLADVRNEYLASLGEADADVVDEVPADAEHSLELDEVDA